MSTIKDQISDIPYHYRKQRTRISNAWYRLAGQRIRGWRTGISNWRNQRILDRGRRSRITQAADQVRSRMPVYRNRVNRATGHPHRDDVSTGRVVDASLARLAPGCAARHAAHGQTAPDREDRAAETLDCGLTWEDRAYHSRGAPDPFAVRTVSPRITDTRPVLAGRSATTARTGRTR